MSKKTLTDALEELVASIAFFPEGASLQDLDEALGHSSAHRTLQRRLSLLVKQGKISVQGDSRSRRYLIIPEQANCKDSFTDSEKLLRKMGSISLSKEGRDIQMQVSQPIHKRPFVNYHRAFLDSYKPNVTFYLPESVRKRCLEIGTTDGKRPAGTHAREIYGRLLIDLSWNSSRLEGNTYSLLETERLLEFSEIAEGKNLEESQMILNHKVALEFLVESAEAIGMNQYTILNLHALLSNNLLGNPESCGRLRKIPVGIAKTVYHPTAILPLIEECFQLILTKASVIEDPFEQAFFLMVHLPYLQPFEDVNKRVSRLAANIPLILRNFCPISYVDVPVQTYINALLGVYELNRIDLLRDVFIWAYERSCLLYSSIRQTLGEPDPFRMRYRDLIYKMVTEIVLTPLDKKKAVEFIKQKAGQFSDSEERSRFIETIEIELRSLHEGNIARYRLRPSEFSLWHRSWL
ncbi:MAG: Fic family protein [Chlamydiae bacterium]|nr:Fic family protein [Chlamydiota bacterium]